jgi:hypothetical protein
MFDGILDAFRSVIDRIRDLWDGISFDIPSVDVPVLGRVGGGSIRPSFSIPFFERGGAVTRATLGVLGEGANISATNPEIASPRNIMADTFRQVLNEQQGGNGQPSIVIEKVVVPEGLDVVGQIRSSARLYGLRVA